MKLCLIVPRGRVNSISNAVKMPSAWFCLYNALINTNKNVSSKIIVYKTQGTTVDTRFRVVTQL